MGSSITSRQAGGPDYLLVPSQRLQAVRSVRTLHFTGALAKNASESESLSGLLTDRVLITRVTISAKQALHFRLSFYAKSTGPNADLDQDSFVGAVEVQL